MFFVQTPGKVLSGFLFAYVKCYDFRFLFIWSFMFVVVDVTENNKVLSVLFIADNVTQMSGLWLILGDNIKLGSHIVLKNQIVPVAFG